MVKFYNSLRLLSLFRRSHFVKNILLKIAFQYSRSAFKVNLKTTVYLKPQSSVQLQMLAKSNFKIERALCTCTDLLFCFSLLKSSCSKNL